MHIFTKKGDSWTQQLWNEPPLDNIPKLLCCPASWFGLIKRIWLWESYLMMLLRLVLSWHPSNPKSPLFSYIRTYYFLQGCRMWLISPQVAYFILGGNQKLVALSHQKCGLFWNSGKYGLNCKIIRSPKNFCYQTVLKSANTSSKCQLELAKISMKWLGDHFIFISAQNMVEKHVVLCRLLPCTFTACVSIRLE